MWHSNAYKKLSQRTELNLKQIFLLNYRELIFYFKLFLITNVFSINAIRNDIS